MTTESTGTPSPFTEERVQELFREFKSSRVVVLGDVMLDVYLWGSVDRISPEAPVPVCRVMEETVMLGGAANVAANIAALGGTALLVGLVGNDESGTRLRKKMARLGLSDACLITDPSRPTSRKTRVLADRQQVVRVDWEETGEIGEQTVAEVLEVVRRELASSSALLLQDYDKGTLTSPVIRSLLDMAREEGKPVTVDPKFRHFFDYRGVNLFKPNLREMQHAFGSVPSGEEQGLEGLMMRLKKRVGSRNVLLTRGEQGMTLLDEEDRFSWIPAVNREVYDVSGAGDTVISTITLVLAAGGSAREGALLSNFAASVEVQRRGVRTVSPDDILSAMRRHGGIIEP